jgi:hypothetical protein
MNLNNIGICGNRGWTTSVDEPGLDSHAAVKAVDAQPTDNVVQVDGSGEAEGLAP